MPAPNPKILIVDDEPDLLEITAAYLEMEGYVPLTALNVPAALDIEHYRSRSHYFRHYNAGNERV